MKKFLTAIRLALLTAVLPLLASFGGDSLLDRTFSPMIDSTFTSTAASLALQPDGKIVVGGKFAGAAVARSPFLIRLNADGTPDSTFPAGAGPDATPSIQLQSDGKIVITGAFSKVNGEPHLQIARLNPDGSVDHSFQPALALTNGLYPTFIQTTIETSRGLIVSVYSTDENRTRLYRLNSDGSLDGSFSVGGALAFGDGLTRAAQIAEQNDGKLLVAGSFTNLNGVLAPGLVRLSPSGEIDRSFAPELPPGFIVESIALDLTGSIYIASSYTLLRLRSDGRRDVTFAANVAHRLSALVIQPDGRILAGGDTLARFNSDGTQDFTFDPVLDLSAAQPSALALQPDGRIIGVGTWRPFQCCVGPVVRFESALHSTNHIVHFEHREVTVAENGGSAILRVIRSGNLAEGVRIHFVASSLAPGPVAFKPQEGFLVFEPGESVKPIEVPLIDDQVVNEWRYFGVTLDTTNKNALIVQPDCAVTIQDDEYFTPPPEFFFVKTNFVVSESGHSVFFRVFGRYADDVPAETDVSVRYSVVSGTAKVGPDLPAQSGIIHFYKRQISGWEATSEFYATFTDDNIVEQPETFSIVLSDPSPGFVIGKNQVATATIYDNDDSPPVVTHFPDQFSVPCAAPIVIPFSVSDSDSALDNVTVVASSSDLSLVSDTNLIVSGTGPDRTLTIRPTPHVVGRTRISVVASDGQLASTNWFNFTVASCPGVFNIRQISDQTSPLNASITVPLSASYCDACSSHDPNSIAWSISSDNNILFPSTNLVVSGRGSLASAALTPATNETGRATITVTATDGLNKEEQRFIVTVDFFPPVLSRIVDQSVIACTPLTIHFLVFDPDTDPEQLIVNASADVTNIITALIPGGAGTNRTLTIVPTNAIGSSGISISVTDGQRGSTNRFNVAVGPCTGLPLLSPIGDQNAYENGVISVPLTASFCPCSSVNPPSIVWSASSDNESLFPTSNVSIRPSGSNGTIGTDATLILSPATNQIGRAAVTVIVSDGISRGAQRFNVSINPAFIGTIERAREPRKIAVSFSGATPGTLIVERSTDLRDWFPLQTNFSARSLRYDVPSSGSGDREFFRVRSD